MIETIAQDIRFAVRGLRRNPGFTVVALLTVALGIGLNTAIFSVVYGVLLRPMPYPEADRLVTVWENHELRDGPRNEWTGRTTFVDWRDRNESFEAMAAVTGWAPTLTGADRPEVMNGGLVSPAFFDVLGVQPVLGRGFLPEEEVPGNDRVIVIGYDVWQERFGGEASALGRPMTLNGNPLTVVGVMPEGFRGPIISNAEIWSPLPIDRSRSDRGNYFLRVMGRPRADMPTAAVEADMGRVAAGIASENPIDYADVGIVLQPLRDTVVGPARAPLLILLGTVALVLLISCANVANLLLARASVRGREFAVRASLGAGRGRLVRQLLTESVVLALGGGLIGLGLGVWGTDLLIGLAPAGLPRADQIGLHPVIFLFALLVSLATGLIFGLAPALKSRAAASAQALREGARGSSAGSGGRLRGALVVAELALGVAVLVSAGLLLRSFEALQSVDIGFEPEGTLSAALLYNPTDYPDADRLLDAQEQLEARLASRPGVAAVGMANILPLSGNVNDIGFGVEGRLPEPGRAHVADSWRATPGFFDAMGMRLVAGRLFDDTDGRGGLPVAVVSRSLVEAHFPDEDPIGKRMRVGGVQDPDSPWWTIIGVVETVRTRGLAADPRPEIFVPTAQRASRGMNVVVRAETGDPAALAETLREDVWAIDPNMAITALTTGEELVGASLASERFVSRLLGLFAALALVLGAIGIYGVMAFMVANRTREIGIRMALGAKPHDILGRVLTRGLLLTAVGLTIGLATAVLAGRALESQLFGVRPGDPFTLIVVAGLLAVVALFASFWPARRATRVDPIITLRAE